jgi:hypothetical protein
METQSSDHTPKAHIRIEVLKDTWQAVTRILCSWDVEAAVLAAVPRRVALGQVYRTEGTQRPGRLCGII